jgi:hypothetical protein
MTIKKNTLKTDGLDLLNLIVKILSSLIFIFNKLKKKQIIVVVVVVRIDCSDQKSRNEVISLTYNSPLRVNVYVSAYFVQVQVQLALERVHRVCMCNVSRQIVPWGRHSVEKEVCSRIVS